jgi:cell division inhibitor SepF
MASLWNKTLFYLGLVDEDQQGVEQIEGVQGEVRPVAGEPYMAPPSATSPTSGVRPPGSGVSGRRVEPPSSTRRAMSENPGQAEAGVIVHPAAGMPQRNDGPMRRSEPESQIIVARNFSDAQTLADAIRSGRSVVLDLRSTEPEMVRRIVDFASGLTYALDGKMAKTTQGVILVTPSGVSLGVNEQERLSTLGLYGSLD